MEIIVALHNIRSTYNVGAILRSCDGFGVKGTILSGYTPNWADSELLPHLADKLERQIAKTALGAEKTVKITSSKDILADLKALKEKGWQIVGLENNIADSRLLALNSPKLKEKLGEKVVLMLGEEVEGIDSSLYDLIDLFVEIPMKGQKESFNVSVATGIALYGLTTL